MDGFYRVIVHYYRHLAQLKLEKYKEFLDTFTIQNSEEQDEVEDVLDHLLDHDDQHAERLVHREVRERLEAHHDRLERDDHLVRRVEPPLPVVDQARREASRGAALSFSLSYTYRVEQLLADRGCIDFNFLPDSALQDRNLT